MYYLFKNTDRNTYSVGNHCDLWLAKVLDYQELEDIFDNSEDACESRDKKNLQEEADVLLV